VLYPAVVLTGQDSTYWNVLPLLGGEGGREEAHHVSQACDTGSSFWEEKSPRLGTCRVVDLGMRQR
jgi:hypothetical protein